MRKDGNQELKFTRRISMFRYTICFIKRDNQILLLNRIKPPEMGKWNGVGGKIEENETATDSVIRETFEETGIQLKEVKYVGNVIFKDTEGADGMYVFIANLPSQIRYQTPKVTEEGILDWKTLDWIMDVSNKGVAENIKYYLPKILNGEHHLEHMFIYDKHQLINYSFSVINNEMSGK
jgi:8-oxo-dGTP diphosphatase